jgi:ribosomal-protein-alanine N-acetyltransferase
MSVDEFRVRPGIAEDLTELADIEKQVALDPWSLSQFVSSSLRDNEHSRVLHRNDGEVLGFAIFQQVLDEATLMNIAVRPDYQGRGGARLLLQAVLEALTVQAVQRCLLEVRCSNKRAIELYRRFGFVEDGIRKNYYPLASGREDALLMSCKLVSKQ